MINSLFKVYRNAILARATPKGEQFIGYQLIFMWIPLHEGSPLHLIKQCAKNLSNLAIKGNFEDLDRC